jgi:RHS repeat-associated protein
MTQRDRMLSHSLPTGTYVYDSVDMIAQSTIPTDAGQRKALHLYTASDERVASIELDAANTPVRREYTVRDAASRLLRRFKQEGTAPVRWDEDYIYRGTQLIAAEVETADRTRHFHVDHLGTPRLITGNGGVKISSHDYYPFGEEVTAPGDERLKSTGHERDAKTLDYMHARYYSPVWGRFLSVDPIRGSARKPQTWNRYAYARNNPVRFTDPAGLYTVDCGGDARRCKAEHDKFSIALKQAARSDSLLVRQSAAAYGAYGENNGVVVSFNPASDGGSVPLRYEPNRETQNLMLTGIYVNITPGRPLDASFQGIVVHEGSHVNIASKWWQSLSDKCETPGSTNLTKYADEFMAYLANAVAGSTGKTIRINGLVSGWGGQYIFRPNMPREQLYELINRLLALEYGLHPDNQGTSWSDK